MTIYDNFQTFRNEFFQTYLKSGIVGKAGKKKGGEGQAFLAHCYYVQGLRMGGKEDGLTIGLCAHLKEALKAHGSVFDSESGGIFVDPRDGKKDRMRWEIWHNDCFILGGIHAHAKFTLVAPNEMEEKWKKENAKDMETFAGVSRQLDHATTSQDYPLRVTQRELIALNIFGYKSTDQGGQVVFTVDDETKADSATMREYVSNVVVFENAAKGA